MLKLTPRRVYDTPARTYFGWDLRETDLGTVVWKRTPWLTGAEIQNWPYRFEAPADMSCDFTISVQGDPADSLLTAWLEEEEEGGELSCLAIDSPDAP